MKGTCGRWQPRTPTLAVQKIHGSQSSQMVLGPCKGQTRAMHESHGVQFVIVARGKEDYENSKPAL
jgi:hypothetical protein